MYFSTGSSLVISSSRTGNLQHLLVALEQLWLGLVQALDNALHELARLVLELLLGRAQHLLEDPNELRCQALDSRLVGFV